MKKIGLISFTVMLLCLLIGVISYDFINFSKTTLSYYGSKGSEVRNIQTRLRNWGYLKGSVDGVYGYKTYRAVRLFQYKNGLDVDGVAGPETLSALGLRTGIKPSTSSKSSYLSNLNLMAHLIHGEARGEPYTGQVAVGAVIVNRTQDPKFPKTIASVIYQPGAFDAVRDGQINLEPNKTARKAAGDCLNGWDPSGNAIYYFNPATATSKWIWSRTIVKVIGKHYFAK